MRYKRQCNVISLIENFVKFLSWQPYNFKWNSYETSELPQYSRAHIVWCCVAIFLHNDNNNKNMLTDKMMRFYSVHVFKLWQRSSVKNVLCWWHFCVIQASCWIQRARKRVSFWHQHTINGSCCHQFCHSFCCTILLIRRNRQWGNTNEIFNVTKMLCIFFTPIIC